VPRDGGDAACVRVHRGGPDHRRNARRHRIVGSRHADRIAALAGDDAVHARAGRDRVKAGDGDDRVHGDAHSDLLLAGDGADKQSGGRGNDTLHTRDGEADEIDCGRGRDRALLDEQDVIVDAKPANLNGSCEFVVRAPPTGEEKEPQLQG
jgi:Ca2+-binding RTX toxin-like protein